MARPLPGCSPRVTDMESPGARTDRCRSLGLVGYPWCASDRQNSRANYASGRNIKKRGSSEHRRNLFFHRPTTMPKMAVGEGNDSDTIDDTVEVSSVQSTLVPFARTNRAALIDAQSAQ